MGHGRRRLECLCRGVGCRDHTGVARARPARKSVSGIPMKLDRARAAVYALSQATGEIIWHTPHPGCHDKPGCSPAQSAAVTAIPGVVFSGGLTVIGALMPRRPARSSGTSTRCRTIRPSMARPPTAARSMVPVPLSPAAALRQFGIHQLRHHARQRVARVFGGRTVGAPRESGPSLPSTWSSSRGAKRGN